MTTNIEKALEIFKLNNGILRNSEARDLGIHPQTLKRMTDRGIIRREERGLYTLIDKKFDVDPDLLNIAKLVPKAVFCLLTALSYHEMTTQIPRRVYIALPFSYKRPDISYPPLDIVNLSGASYTSGIEKYMYSGVEISVYNKAKTVADCFKFRRKIGETIAIEALREFLDQQDHNIQELLDYAEINRVKKKIEPYIKAII